MKLHFIKNWTGSVLAYNPEGEPYNYERLRNQRVIWIQSLNSKPQPFKYRRTNFKGKSMVYSHSWKDVPAPGTIFNPRTEDKWIERSGMCVVKKIEEFSSNVGYELLVKEIKAIKGRLVKYETGNKNINNRFES